MILEEISKLWAEIKELKAKETELECLAEREGLR